MTADSPLRLALLNYADVNNFGDVLFPLLTARELRRRLPSAAIDFISPTGTGPAPATRYDAASLARYDAIVLAGGELIHRYDRVLSAIYASLDLDAIDNPTDLVFGWSHVRGPYKAWFGLGVPPLDQRGAASIRGAAPGLDMVHVRGTGSARRLREAGGTCTIGPDIGWLFSGLLETPPAASRRRYVVFHALPPGVPENLGVIVEPLRALERRGFEIVLLPLSTCWQDYVVLGRIADTSGFRLLDYRTPELTKLAILAGSAFYVGQSMHGFISTLASGQPAGLCFPRGDDKFGELLGDNGLEDLRIDTWNELPSLIDRLLRIETDRVCRLRASTSAQASAAFDTLADNVRRHAERRRRVH